MYVKDLEKNFLFPEATLRDAVQFLDQCAHKIALVVNHERKLLGTVTDGDCRRALLKKNASFEVPVTEVMNTSPRTLSGSPTREKVYRKLIDERISQIPIVDEEGRIKDLATRDHLLLGNEISNPVLIMAGGAGKRLYPLTRETPKPMLTLGGQPLLGILVNSLIAQGFRKFYFSVNYHSQVIKNYFGDGSQLNADISYIEEDKPLGTAGALSLIKEIPKEPFFVINGDILTGMKFKEMLHFHQEHGAHATMAVSDYQVQVPYGVIELEGHSIAEIVEKPITKHFVNAGIYLLDPELLKLVPSDQSFNMTELFIQAKKLNKKTLVFPIHEYWRDIGRKEDYDDANLDIEKLLPKLSESISDNPARDAVSKQVITERLHDH